MQRAHGQFDPEQVLKVHPCTKVGRGQQAGATANRRCGGWVGQRPHERLRQCWQAGVVEIAECAGHERSGARDHLLLGVGHGIELIEGRGHGLDGSLEAGVLIIRDADEQDLGRRGSEAALRIAECGELPLGFAQLLAAAGQVMQRQRQPAAQSLRGTTLCRTAGQGLARGAVAGHHP